MMFFDAETPLPSTKEGCADEIEKIVDAMTEIDVQFAFYAKGLSHQDDPSWHPRALARKSHLSRRLKRTKREHQKFIEAERLEREAKRKESKNARIEARRKLEAEHAANRAAKAEKAKAQESEHFRKLIAVMRFVREKAPHLTDEMHKIAEAEERR